jgi:anti-anti-sigma factor
MRHAPPQRIEIAADEARLCEVRDFVDRACEAAGFTPRAAANVRLAVDEACTNVIKHAYADATGSLSITCGTRGRWLEIRILDHGAAFDGRIDLQHLSELVASKRKGGLGVFLMHRLMDHVQYQTTPGGNEWILRKRLPQPASDLTQRVRARWAVRAAIGLVVVSLAAVAPLWVHVGRERDRSEMSALRAHAFGLAEAARPVLVERAELGPDQTHLFEAVHAIARQEPRLVSIEVVDNDGSIWAADRAAATFTRHVPVAGFGPADADGVQTARARVDGMRLVRLALPVRVGADGSTIGTVHVSMRWDATAAAIRAARLRLLGGALALDLVVLALAAAALTAFLRPLQRLVDGVRGLSQDDRALAEDGPAEIGAIAQAFNDIHARYRAAAENAAEHERLQEEMRLAREIQAAILPQELPTIPGYELARLYRPAAQVGGDYYDFLDAGAGLTGVVVADVAGKGVPGSMVMGMIRTALRMETRRNAHARDVLARLHQFLAADMRNGMFVTMLYVVLDTRHRVVSYASAGHTPMILYRAATDETFSLAARGMPVGVAGSDATQFERQLDVERLRMRKDDLLLMYTDGVTEATNAEGEAYGEARLVGAVQRWGKESAAQFVRRLEDDLHAFLGGAAPGDDLTLVAIKETQESPLLEGELQRKLVDLVETRGLPVADACRRLKVSPSTYYRLRGTTADAAEQLPVDKRAVLLQHVQAAPESEPTALATALASSVGGEFDAARVEAELARLGLGTAAARRTYAASAGVRAGLALDGAAAPALATAPPAPVGVAPAATPHALVVVESNVDSQSCAALEERLERAAADAPLVLVDLGAARYVSSRAWGLLAQAATRLRPHGAVALVGMRPEVHEVYRMLGFDAVLRAYADRDAALAGAGPAPDAAAAVATSPAPSAAPTQAATVATPAGDEERDWAALGLRVGRADAAGEVTLLALEGVLDTVTAARLEPELAAVLARGARCMLADLSRVDFVSSAAWGGLASLAASLRARGGGLHVFGMSPAVQRIHALLHLDAVLPSHDEFATALAALGVAGVAPPTPAGATAEAGGFESGALRARIEPYGTSGRASRLVLRGRMAAADGARLATWLEGEAPAVEFLLVDACALSDAEPDAWRPLGGHARQRAGAGRAFAVVAAAVTPPADCGLAVHASVAAALRARQGAGRLLAVAGDASEQARDAAIRRDGWDAYLRLLRRTLQEGAA